MFLWNNLFFSLAFDGRDHYKAYGGDEAAHAAAVSMHTHTYTHARTHTHT